MARNEQGAARTFTDQDGNRSGYVRNSEGDLYAGKDGEVYKREDGQWYKNGDDGWDPVDRDTSAAAERRASRDGDGQRQPGAAGDFDRKSSDVDATSMRSDPKQYRQMGAGAESSLAGPPADTGSNRYDRPGGDSQRGGLSGSERGRDTGARELDRNHRARSNGFDRHNSSMSRRSMGGGTRGGGRRGGGRRR
jgi:hypothetical protein